MAWFKIKVTLLNQEFSHGMTRIHTEKGKDKKCKKQDYGTVS